MKKLFLILFAVVMANAAINQNSVLGNWTLSPISSDDPNAIIVLESNALKVEGNWKFSEVSTYNINYPGYGKQKIHLQYKLKTTISGEYRIEDGAFRRYIKSVESAVVTGSATDVEAAKQSIKEVEKLIREELKEPQPVGATTETTMELQSPNGALHYTKPIKRPNSKITGKIVPFMPPEGWRFPESPKELEEFAIRTKHDAVNLFTIAEGDFNGDGTDDAAAFLINEAKGQVALFLNLSGANGSFATEVFDGKVDRNTKVENGVIIAMPGEYTDTGKKKINITLPGIMFVIFDTATTLYYWDEEKSDWATAPLGKKY